MTSERNLLTIKTAAPITHAALSPKGNTLSALDSNSTLTVWKMDIPHPGDFVQHPVRQGLVRRL